MQTVKRTERGWPGHFCVSNRCLFRRNTLLEYKDIKIVVSTVGAMESKKHMFEENTFESTFEEIGIGRYYETMCFHALKDDEIYNDIDVTKEIHFDSNWRIEYIKYDSDNEANDMHEKVVTEITNNLLKGMYA